MYLYIIVGDVMANEGEYLQEALNQEDTVKRAMTQRMMEALVFGEAGNQGLDTQLMVLGTVDERLNSDMSYLKGTDRMSTILKPNQYTAVNDDKYKAYMAGKVDPKYNDEIKAAKYAVEVYNKGGRSTSKGITHFHSKSDQFAYGWTKPELMMKRGKSGDLWTFKEMKPKTMQAFQRGGGYGEGHMGGIGGREVR